MLLAVTQVSAVLAASLGKDDQLGLRKAHYLGVGWRHDLEAGKLSVAFYVSRALGRWQVSNPQHAPVARVSSAPS